MEINRDKESLRTGSSIKAFFARFRLALILGVSTVLFSTSTILHFKSKGSLLEFFIALITIVFISALLRFSTKDIVLRLQNENHEFLGVLLNGILG